MAPTAAAAAATALPSPSHRHNSAAKSVWLNPKLSSSHPLHHRHRSAELQQRQTEDRTINVPALVAELSAARTAPDLAAAVAPYRPVSGRLLGALLSRLPDPRRGVALLDLLAPDIPPPALLIPYNLLLRSACRAGELRLASGLLLEMRDRGVAPDAFSYSTLLAALTRAGHLDHALTFLPLMEGDAVAPDLILFSNLIHLALRAGDAPKALALFSRLRGAGIKPDLKAYNAAVAAYCRSDLLRDAKRLLLHDMPSENVAPDAETYAPVLAALARRGRHIAAVSLFSHMRAVARVRPDISVFNIVLNAYGQLDLAREADRLFRSMRRAGVPPSVVTYNTMLRVYGDAGLFGEAAHLFSLMRSASDGNGGTGGGVKPNVVTYNTMIAIYGKSLEDEKAGSLVQDMQANGVQPNAITYSTILSIWVKAGKLDRAAKLFEKLRETGTEIDPVLYQTMVVAYERSGLVSQAKRLLHDLKDPEGIPKETAIKILASAGRLEEAAWLFHRAASNDEIKDSSVHRAMMDLFAKNRRHRNVVEVFDEMTKVGQLPDSETIATVMNAFGKLKEFDKPRSCTRQRGGKVVFSQTGCTSR
jgi:pentatricopeptide repeat protein